MNSDFSRRRFVRTAALGSAAVVVGARLRAQPAKFPRKPNLLVFLPDQLRADTVFGENASGVHAPNIHKLASQSTIFERAYVTQPICAPSRSSLFSGMWPHQTGCMTNKGVLSRKVLCLPELLRDSSYRTGYFGKWHLGDEFCAQHGFQEWSSIEESFKTPDRKHRTGDASDYTHFLVSRGYKPDMRKGKYFSKQFATTLPFELSKPKFLEARVLEFLQRHHREPFLLVVGFLEPHPPYNGPFNSEHSIDSISLEASADDVFGNDVPLQYRVWQQFYRNKVGGPDQFRETKQKYLGLITEVDNCIGSILAKIEELEIADRTVTALSSDHGDMMSAHGLLGKQVMFEQSVAVPYLVRVPGVSPRRISRPVSHIDFAPTMLDLLGGAPHPQHAGKSRASVIRGDSTPADFVFVEWTPDKPKLSSKNLIRRYPGESTRTVVSPDGWKLSLRNKDKNELYNLRDDPDERKNLYFDAGHSATVKRLTDEIYQWQQRVGDTLKV